MNDDERLAKLPKWVQDKIANLERERDVAVRALNEFTDSQTPSAMFVEEYVCTGEKAGPSVKRRYVTGQRLKVEHRGIEFDIFLSDGKGHTREPGFHLSWSLASGATSHTAMIPKSFQSIAIIAKEDME